MLVLQINRQRWHAVLRYWSQILLKFYTEISFHMTGFRSTVPGVVPVPKGLWLWPDPPPEDDDVGVGT